MNHHENSMLIDSKPITNGDLIYNVATFSTAFKKASQEKLVRETLRTSIIEIAKEEMMKEIYRNSLVNDITFWKLLVENEHFKRLNSFDTKLANFENRIENRIENSSRLASKNENLSFASKIPEMVEKIVDRSTPLNVSREIKKQLPSYLDNNYEMQNILNNHISKLQTELENRVDKILNEITSQSSYHTINQKYFDVFQSKTDKAISNFEKETERSLKNLTNKYNQDFKELESNLKECKLANIRLANLEAKNNMIENDSKSIYGALLFTTAVSLITIGVVIVFSK